MIGIKECNNDIATVADQHFQFVKERVNSTLSFYHSIFEYLQQINGKRINDATINANVKTLKTKHKCDHYKSLLNHFLKADKKIKNENEGYLIRKADDRRREVKNIPTVLAALSELKKRYKLLLKMDFNSDMDRYHRAYQQIKSECNGANFLLEKIFDYDWFTGVGADKPWGPYQLTKGIGLNCCSYCNRQYTFTVSVVGGKKVARPQLDHFLPQKYHPLLALSFYNLIPSCAVCNASIKGAVNTSYSTHISPYKENLRHGLMRFTYIPESYEASVGVADDLRIELKYNGNPVDLELKRCVEGNIDLFFLEKMYENHKDEVRDIIFKRSATNDQYIKMTQRTFKHLNLSEADAYRLAFGTYYSERDFHRRPLSKLTKDIAYELGALRAFS